MPFKERLGKGGFRYIHEKGTVYANATIDTPKQRS